MAEEDGVIGLPKDRIVYRCGVTVDNCSTVGMLLDPTAALLDKAKRHIERECLKQGMALEGPVELGSLVRTHEKLNATYLCILRPAHWLEQISLTIKAAMEYQPEGPVSGIIVRH